METQWIHNQLFRKSMEMPRWLAPTHYHKSNMIDRTAEQLGGPSLIEASKSKMRSSIGRPADYCVRVGHTSMALRLSRLEPGTGRRREIRGNFADRRFGVAVQESNMILFPISRISSVVW